MGKVGSKQRSDPYDDHRKVDEPKQVAPVKKNSALNNRIINLTESLTNVFQVEKVFNRELKEINASFGDEEIKKSLIELRDRINERFNTIEGHKLAFQIQCTAQALSPHFDLSRLPPDVQQIIFYHYGADTTDLKDLSDDFGSKNAIEARIGWINGNHISLKKVGCNNAKDAVQYIIDHKLVSANLSEFQDLTDVDLLKLCENCPYLESLSINLRRALQDVSALKKLTNLQSLSIAGCNQLLGAELVKVIGKLTTLKSLNVNGGYELPGKEFVEALASLINLQSLSVRSCYQLPVKEFVKVLASLINLQSLDVSYCAQLSEKEFAEALVSLINLQSLNVRNCRQLRGKEFVKVLASLINLQSLDVSYCTQLPGKEFFEAVANLANLQSLDISRFKLIPGKEFVETLTHLVNLQRLTVKGCDQIGEEFDDALANLAILANLDIVR